jgi:hypothetical protein
VYLYKIDVGLHSTVNKIEVNMNFVDKTGELRIGSWELGVGSWELGVEAVQRPGISWGEFPSPIRGEWRHQSGVDPLSQKLRYQINRAQTANLRRQGFEPAFRSATWNEP